MGSVPGLERFPREMAKHPVFLPGKSYGQRSLVGYSPWGRKRVRYDLATIQKQHLTLNHPALEIVLFLDLRAEKFGKQFCSIPKSIRIKIMIISANINNCYYYMPSSVLSPLNIIMHLVIIESYE